MSLLKPKVLILSKIFSFIFSDVNGTTQGGVAKNSCLLANDFFILWFQYREGHRFCLKNQGWLFVRMIYPFGIINTGLLSFLWPSWAYISLTDFQLRTFTSFPRNVQSARLILLRACDCVFFYNCRFCKRRWKNSIQRAITNNYHPWPLQINNC
jgi:hypothetical protein